ncbi:hypothetical protein CLAFUW4_12931 [Fulvia fulva]|nr:hypothetical protein CLAFUR4_12935 [Fulvia fulva]WPV21059.1 hypothetical protein CLAFUW4_12931 [Fulvia fulva]
MKSIIAISALTSLTTLTTAFPTSDDRNWELYTNDLGYAASRFKPGQEPGTEAYAARFGSNNVSDASIFARQDNRRTEPLVGQNAIPYGCITDIPNTVLSKLYDICGDLGCDGGATVSVDVKYPDNGNEGDATVTLAPKGRWPSGMRDAMIQAVQAEAIPEAVETEEVTSYFQQNSPFNPSRTYKCNVSKSTNFFSIIVRNNDDESQVANLDVSVSFMKNRDSIICGTAAAASGAVVGAINGIAGGLFGFVQALVCNS